MSGQQIGSAVGFVAGFFLPGGPAVWSTIGGFIGGAIDPTKTYGPRLTDGMAVTAQDGIPNPWGFGTFAVGCNVLNAFDLVEHAHTDDGKGSGQENTTYTYSRSYALGICRAKRKTDGTYDPIAGVLRATHNGKVVYNAAPDATSEQLAQNAKFLKTYKFYLGGEDQLPDPTLESYLGAGNVSAYRGQVYMVATDEDEAQHGSIGSWEFVVAMEGTVDPVLGGYVAGRVAGFADSEFPLTGGDDEYSYTGYLGAGGLGGTTISYSSNSLADVLEHFRTLDYTPHGGGTRSFQHFLGYSASTGINTIPGIGLVFDDFGMSNVADQPSVIDNARLDLVYNDLAPDHVHDSPFWSGFCAIGDDVEQDNRGIIGKWFPSAPGGQWESGENCDTGGVYLLRPLVVKVSRKRLAPLSHPPEAKAIPDVPGYYVMPDGSVIADADYESEAGTFHVLSQLSVSTEVDGREQYSFYENGPAVPSTAPNYNDSTYWTGIYNTALTEGRVPAGWTFGVEYPVPVTSAWKAGYDSILLERRSITLAEIIAEVCRRSGLEDADFDVSQLTDTLDGFKVAVEATGESVIQSLMQGFFFDCGEWDDKLRFIKRGGDVVAELTVDDLAERDGPAIEETQVQEVELLRKVIVKTMDPGAGYVETTQVAERRTSTVDAKGEQTLQIAIVADKDAQAQIADKRLKVAWSELRRFSMTLPYTRPDLTVTDVVGLTDKKGRRQRVRLMEMSEDTGRIEVSEAMLDRQAAYTSNVEGVQKDPPTDTSPGIIGPTYFWAGNLPSLRTSDNVPGIYIAACGYMRAWGGAEILLSVDDGVSYQRVATIIQPSTMGSLTASVTNSSEPISVFMNSGALSSITDAQVANRMNAFAITTAEESEVGQFKTATQGAAREYDLTDTARGQLGTTAAAHATGDPFVLLATALFLPLDISLSGRALKFKAVSLGTSSDETEVYDFVFRPKFTSVTVEQITVGGDPITVNNDPIYKVTSNG